MSKTLFYIIGAGIVMVGVFYALNSFYTEKQGDGGAQTSYKNIAYTIEGEAILLKDGYAEIEVVPGSASKMTTEYFGNEAEGDLNGDGISDIAFLLTQNAGGTGTFFYVVAAVKTDTGYTGTNAILLGDRVAPQTTEYRNGGIIVNYAIRRADEPMTTEPSVGISKFFKVLRSEFVEVELNFEGEADPSRMTLDMKTWVWQNAFYNDGTQVKPKELGAFTLNFGKDGTFSATTDCNAVGGSYSTNQSSIIFEDMYATKKYCEGSQEGAFSKLLTNSTSYLFTSKGELILEIKFDSGTATFR